MMKSICVLARRPDLSRDEFQTYYEDHHAPLGVKHFPFTRYVRNHVIDAEDIGFDTISEFWADDIVAVASLMNGPVGDILREDERRFMDQSKIAPGSAEEKVLSEGGAAAERYAVLLNWSGDDALVTDWATAIARQVSGISLDFVTSWQEPAFPARAVLWAPYADCVADYPDGVEATSVRVRRCETPAEALQPGQ